MNLHQTTNQYETQLFFKLPHRGLLLHANSCLTFNPAEYDMNYLLERKKYDRKKSDAEEVLMKMIESGRVKVGSPEYNKRCEYIEFYADMAHRYHTRYEENA